jgi:hypothetical protein
MRGIFTPMRGIFTPMRGIFTPMRGIFDAMMMLARSDSRIPPARPQHDPEHDTVSLGVNRSHSQ